MSSLRSFFFLLVALAVSVGPGGPGPASAVGPATGPLQVHPTNPRYFTDGTGKAIYLTGSNHGWELQDNAWGPPSYTLDYTAFLNWLVAHNLNHVRLWVVEHTAIPTAADIVASPIAFTRSDVCCANDGGMKFDLNSFDQAYFDRLRSRVVEAGTRGIYVSVMLFQGWSLGKGCCPYDAWFGHPFNAANNINGIDGDTNGDGFGGEAHTLAIPEITQIQKAYVQRVVDTVNDLDNVIYEISNESNPDSTDWQYDLISHIKNYEATFKPNQHPVLMSFQYPAGDNETLYASPADAVSPNLSAANPPPADTRKVTLLDTDHFQPYLFDPAWVWKSFTRGHNPIIIDDYAPEGPSAGGEPTRNAMGDTLRYADRMNLAAMTPRGDLTSTGYALANPGFEYLVLQPQSRPGAFTVTLAPGTYSVEWFDVTDRTTEAGGEIEVRGRANTKSFRPPFAGPAVLFLKTS